MENRAFPKLVVCDAGPLIHLDELLAISLLGSHEEVLVPLTVWQEVQHHRPSALRRRGVAFRRVDALPGASPEARVLFDALELDAGEQEALCLTMQLSGAELLSDDGDARLAAERLQLPSRGTIGVIVQAFFRGQRSKRQVLRLLRSIPRLSTLHVRPAFLATVIREMEQEEGA